MKNTLKYFYIFFMSMIPIIELRGAVPLGVSFNLPFLKCLIVCIIGNIIPVPFIYLFARKILIWGSNKKYIGKIFTNFLIKGEKAGKKLLSGGGKYGAYIGLLLFVGIPLPGTGAWTGTLAASILDLDFKKSIISVLVGVILAGFIMTIISVSISSAVKLF